MKNREDESCGHCDACQNRAEAAYERYLERFYGGEIVTMREEQISAWEQKRGLK